MSIQYDPIYLATMTVAQTGLSDGRTATFAMTWTLGPKKPDILQIYYSFTEDVGLENVPGPYAYQAIDPSAKQPYPVSVSAIGYPAIVSFALAPRLVADDVPQPDMPDEADEDLPFYEFAAQQILEIHYQPQAKPIAAAKVAAVQSNPKTLETPNRFLVTCTATGGTINDFHLIPTENGTELQQVESSTGVFTQNSTPGYNDTFKTQACNQENGWGPWSPVVSAVATQNYHSVAAFLAASNVKLPTGLKPIVAQHAATSLRNLMGI